MKWTEGVGGREEATRVEEIPPCPPGVHVPLGERVGQADSLESSRQQRNPREGGRSRVCDSPPGSERRSEVEAGIYIKAPFLSKNVFCGHV